MDGTPGLQSGTFAGRYTVERELGRGATASVYLARDTVRGHGVAIKVLRPELAESLGAERFLREIKVNERLHHPHIASVLDSGQYEGQLYFVLPHMEGGSLRQMLQREKQLPIEAAVSITRTVALALDYAHKQGLIHRDVKPENILFTSGQACLADFGIARAIERAIDESTTSTGLVRGTPAYMSPEQASGSTKYDGRSDQYSLACVLYEMLAGVPAFIGPTPEAVIAMRFQHSPREVRVYRSAVSPALSGVIDRALSLMPADRYTTMSDFADAMDAALRAPIVESRTSGASVGALPSRHWAFVGAGIVGVAALVTLGASVRTFWTREAVAGDTTRTVIFPFAATTGAAGGHPEQLLANAFRRWQGVTVVPLDQTTEALSHDADGVLTSAEQREIARALGAGRYVVGQVLHTPTGEALAGDYRDVNGGTLYAAQVELPRESARITTAYAALVDSLLLRGRTDAGPPRPLETTRSLGATQLMIRGLDARDAWNLELADSLFVAASELDPSSPRAFLWLAQVRSWRGLPEDRWIVAAERGGADTARLLPAERQMSRALVHLARKENPAACDDYQRLLRGDERSFLGWYGLGECHFRDVIVAPDPRSPSGWRFRSSYEQALRAYARAFELLPVTYQGFQAAAYSRLRTLFFTSARTFRSGHTATTPTRDFLAVPIVQGDTIALIPQDRSLVTSGQVRLLTPVGALTRQRALFHQIAVRWASAFPGSAGAKEGLAISLELQGDRAAADSMRAAQKLATTPEDKLRLASASTLLQAKFAVPDRIDELVSARAAADSLLAVYVAPTADQAALLAPLAALVGRCRQAANLLRLTPDPIDVPGLPRIPQDIRADAGRLHAAVFLGCSDLQRSLPTFDNLASRIPMDRPNDAARRQAEYLLLGSLVRATVPPDSEWIARLAPVGGVYFAANLDALTGQRERALQRLNALEQNRRASLPGETTPDVLLAEARLRLQLADTASALRSLQSALTTVRLSPPFLPQQASNNVARIGSLIRAMLLRAELSPTDAEGTAWAHAAATLWADADAELRPIVDQVKR